MFDLQDLFTGSGLNFYKKIVTKGYLPQRKIFLTVEAHSSKNHAAANHFIVLLWI